MFARELHDVGYKEPPGGPFVSPIMVWDGRSWPIFRPERVQQLGRLPVNPALLRPDRDVGQPTRALAPVPPNLASRYLAPRTGAVAGMPQGGSALQLL